MTSDLIGFDLFTLKGDPLERAMAALRVARLHVQLAYASTDSVRLEEVLSDIEEEVRGGLKSIENAIEDDADDFYASPEWVRDRQAELPLRVA
jgi:hypothetical protein